MSQTEEGSNHRCVLISTAWVWLTQINLPGSDTFHTNEAKNLNSKIALAIFEILYIFGTRWNHFLLAYIFICVEQNFKNKAFSTGLSIAINLHINRTCEHQMFHPLSFVKHPYNILLIQHVVKQYLLSTILSNYNRTVSCSGL